MLMSTFTNWTIYLIFFYDKMFRGLFNKVPETHSLNQISFFWGGQGQNMCGAMWYVRYTYIIG